MKLTIYIVCLSVAAMLLLTAVCVVTPQAEQAPQKQQAQANEKISSSPIVGFFKLVGGCLRENGSVVAAVATVVIAIFTIVLASVSRRQAELARKAMIARERAFVFPVDLRGEWEPIAGGGYGWRFRPRWFNSGNTPTKNLEIFVTGELHNGLVPDSFNFSTPSATPGKNLLAPHYGSWAGLVPPIPNPPITTQNLLDIQMEKKVLYMWGWAKYNDVFQEKPMHVSKFCWLIVPNGNPATFNPLGPPQQFTFIANAKGNCADDECPDQG